ncbi:MAG: hypothetical protein V3V59_03665 [Thermodesulfovibrionales bacterium]
MIKIFSSWWIFFSLIIVILSVYIYLTFGDDPYAMWKIFIFQSPPGISAVIMIIINLLAINIRTISEKIHVTKPDTEAIQTMDACEDIHITNKDQMGSTIEWMTTKGFKPGEVGSSFRSVKGKYSFLPGVLLRTGIIVLMIAVISSIYIRRSEEVSINENAETEILGQNIKLNSIKSNMPKEFFQVGEQSTFKLHDLTASVTLAGSDHIITNGLPIKIGGRYYRLTHIGLYQPFNVRNDHSHFSIEAPLDILPPGKTDIANSPVNDLLFTFRLDPEKTIKKGLLTGKVYDLKVPTYSVVIQKGKKKDTVKKFTMKPNESRTFEGFHLELKDQGTYVKIMAVHDPALLWIYTGIIMTLSGLTLMTTRFFWYRTELCVIYNDNKVSIGYSEEFFKKWGIQKFYNWMEELK